MSCACWCRTLTRGPGPAVALRTALLHSPPPTGRILAPLQDRSSRHRRFNPIAQSFPHFTFSFCKNFNGISRHTHTHTGPWCDGTGVRAGPLGRAPQPCRCGTSSGWHGPSCCLGARGSDRRREGMFRFCRSQSNDCAGQISSVLAVNSPSWRTI